MTSSLVHRLLPALSVASYGLAFELTNWSYSTLFEHGFGTTGDQQVHVVSALLLLYLTWRLILWYHRDSPFAYRWLIYLLPLLGLEALSWVWSKVGRLAHDQQKPHMDMDDAERSAYMEVTSMSTGYVPLLVIILAHLSSERASMARQVSVFEAMCVLAQACITVATSVNSIAQVSWLMHVSLIGNALLAALRLAYLGRLIRRKLVSEGQLFGLGAIDRLNLPYMLRRLPRSFYGGFWSRDEQPLLGTVWILTLEAVRTWVVPTVVLIQLGSVAAAELSVLIPSYIRWTWGRWNGAMEGGDRDDSYAVYDGISFGLAVLFLASAVRTRWMRDQAPPMSTATNQPPNAATSDERVELVA